MSLSIENNIALVLGLGLNLDIALTHYMAKQLSSTTEHFLYNHSLRCGHHKFTQGSLGKTKLWEWLVHF